jgi:hypothetical protein
MKIMLLDTTILVLFIAYTNMAFFVSCDEFTAALAPLNEEYEVLYGIRA